MSASLPSVTSLPSLPPFAHSKLTALPALDMEHDRLARACGQGPVFTFRSDCVPSSSRSIYRSAGPSEASSTTTMSSASPPKVARTSSELRASTAAPPAPLNLDDTVLSVPFELGWGLRPRATSVRVSARHGAAASGGNAGAAGGATHLPHRPRSASQPASIPVFCPSSPRGVLRSLRDVLDLEGMQLEECLDVRQVFERWERGLARCEAVQLQHQHQQPRFQKTFGAPVSVAVKGASMSTVLGGYQLDVPWVVYACVEELNRTGIYQPGLFRAVPNRARLTRLIDAFDLPCAAYPASPEEDDMCPKVAPTASVTRASLRKESMPDICALLKTYLDLLPEPLLDANLTSALYTLCVKPCLEREDEMDETGSDSDGGYFASHGGGRARSAPPSASSHMSLDVPMTPSEHRNAQLSLEAPQILLAQHILRLAPPHSLALLAYLLGFFTQLPLCPDNGMDFADVARMFGRVLVGGPGADAEVVRECVRWLLERWARVSDGLLDVVPHEERADESESAPASACKTSFGTFSAPEQHPCAPMSSREPTPRQRNDAGQMGVDMARVKTETQMQAQMPYDPGLVGPLAPIQTFFRPHSTSVSSDGSTASSATSSSFDMDEDAYVHTWQIGGGYGRTEEMEGVNAKHDGGAMVGEVVVPEERVYELFDGNARIASRYGLEREYVSCPSSPHSRPFSETRFSSPAASVRSLEVDGGSWPSSSSSEATSRCSPPPSYALDGDGLQSERTPRNSTSY
ncbi:hypothetical protein C8Q73DRAFT_748298 [Cubamyces lactineus]|nr:hypothetical protein C8Q73DRAFT_748298 [Cubamyces lactineus]